MLDLGFGFIELGPVTAEQQHPAKLFQQTLKINLSNRTVTQLNKKVTPAVNFLIENLVERQYRIGKGEVKQGGGKMIGINIQANIDT